jgi:hypothetical protein
LAAPLFLHACHSRGAPIVFQEAASICWGQSRARNQHGVSAKPERSQIALLKKRCSIGVEQTLSLVNRPSPALPDPSYCFSAARFAAQRFLVAAATAALPAALIFLFGFVASGALGADSAFLTAHLFF